MTDGPLAHESAEPQQVLFLCTHNSSRSQIAEGLLKARGGARSTAFSAGTHPRTVHPYAVKVMADIGIDIREQAGHQAKGIDALLDQPPMDLVITVCDEAAEECPTFPRARHQKYWGGLHLDRRDSWVFGDKQTGGYLLKFRWFPIERHTLVTGTASPDDPRLKDYWTKRQAAQAKDLTLSSQKLARRQQGRCPECGETLFNEEELQIHHLLAQSQGGKDTYSNLVLVHLLCHQHIHAKTTRAMSDCQHLNDQSLLAEQKLIHRSLRQEKNKELCST